MRIVLALMLVSVTLLFCAFFASSLIDTIDSMHRLQRAVASDFVRNELLMDAAVTIVTFWMTVGFSLLSFCVALREIFNLCER